MKKKGRKHMNRQEDLNKAGRSPQEEAAQDVSAGPETPEENAAREAAMAAEAAGEAEETDPCAEGSKTEETASAKDPRDDRIAELNDKVMRQMAEFDNFRRRTDKEKSEMFDMGVRSMVEKILPVVDNFERGLSTSPESAQAKAYADGMNMVYRQMMKALEDVGVKAIDCLGKEFDPNLHNAVMHEEDDSGEENIVSKELQKGYLYKEYLVRPSMVSVKN